MFSLADLTPARDPFELGDGRTIYFRNRADFDLQELAAWERLLKTLGDANKMKQSSKHEQQHIEATRRSDQAQREMIGLVLPDLPGDIMASLTAGKVKHLADICTSVASGQLRSSSPDQEQIAEAAALYPDLPRAFLTSLNRYQVGLLLETPEEEPKPTKNRRAQLSKS